jgi:hypothetical protein
MFVGPLTESPDTLIPFLQTAGLTIHWGKQSLDPIAAESFHCGPRSEIDA